MSPKNRLAILIIALFSVLQLLFIAQPSSLVFDEEHYVKTARLMVRGYPDYNIEHPPLGKQIIATSMRLLGDNPWGWRVPSVLFSIATVIVVFVLARKFFGEKVALLATLLLALDPLWIAISRLAMLDIFATFFTVLFFAAAFHYLENPNLKLAAVSGAALGASLAAKWVGILLPLFFILIVASSHYLKNLKVKTLTSHLLVFLVTVLIIYVATYFPALKIQERPSFTERLLLPLLVHLGAKASTTAAYDLNSLLWFTTPFLGATPIFKEASTRVALFFNPLSGWFLLASLYSLIKSIIKNLSREMLHGNLKTIFVIFAWFLLYLPWLAQLRPAYLQHIFPLLPFIYLIQAKFGVMLLREGGWGRLLFKGYLAFVVFCSAFLLPFLIGLPISNPCIYSLPFFLLVFAASLTISILELFSPGKVLNFLRRQA